MLNSIKGTYEVKLTGASPERCLNRWAEADVSFRALRKLTEMDYRCRILRSDLHLAQKLAGRTQCELQILSERGLPILVKRLKRRPVLLVGTILAFLAAFFLNRFVWFVRIEGNTLVSDDFIRNVLLEEGVGFGVRTDSIDSEYLKNRILLRIPELRWLAVNTEGSVVTVLAAEREAVEPEEEDRGICDVVAARSGIIRELHVIDGFAQTEVGAAVSEGDVLISGVMQWETRVQATKAKGEVYASTFREQKLMTPDECLAKRYTGRTETCITIIFQRKRRKISGNSGIFGSMCDTMIKTEPLFLPGGFQLPVSVETLTLREYRAEREAIETEDANILLSEEAERLVMDQMISGRIEGGTTSTQKKGNCFVCRAAMNCLELISRTVPTELFGEEDENGEADQR